MHTGEIIKYLRKEKELTQEQLAILLGVRKSSVQKYENGKIQNLKLDTLQKLCKTFRTSPYAFVFPDTWEKIHIQHKGGGNLTHQAMILYLKLSDEGRKKVLEYIKDISAIKRYNRAEDITLELHWLLETEI